MNCRFKRAFVPPTQGVMTMEFCTKHFAKIRDLYSCLHVIVPGSRGWTERRVKARPTSVRTTRPSRSFKARCVMPLRFCNFQCCVHECLAVALLMRNVLRCRWSSITRASSTRRRRPSTIRPRRASTACRHSATRRPCRWARSET